jgi:hypothetical protein
MDVKQKLAEGFRAYLPFVWVLMLMQFMLRIFEFWSAGSNDFIIPFADIATGLLFDLLFACSFAALIFPVYFLFYRFCRNTVGLPLCKALGSPSGRY